MKKINYDISINLSSIAKGYAVDVIYNLIRKNGFENFLIEIGGELRGHGKNEYGRYWKIGIYDPSKYKKRIFQIVILQNQSLATSGIYLNFFKKNNLKFSHIIDPRSGRSLQNKLLSVTVLSNNCMIADILSTSFIILDKKISNCIKNKYYQTNSFFIYNW